jgi:hypothetical protein
MLNLRNKVSVLTLSAFLISLAACTSKPVEYHSKEKGFSIQFPKGWEIKEHTMKSDIAEVVVQAAGNEGNSYQQINVAVENLPNEMGVEEYFQKEKEELSKMLPQFQAVEEGKETLNSQPGRWLVYTMQAKDTQAKLIVYALVKGKQGYSITGGAMASQFDQYRPKFEASARSFKLE